MLLVLAVELAALAVWATLLAALGRYVRRRLERVAVDEAADAACELPLDELVADLTALARLRA